METPLNGSGVCVVKLRCVVKAADNSRVNEGMIRIYEKKTSCLSKSTEVCWRADDNSDSVAS